MLTLAAIRNALQDAFSASLECTPAQRGQAAGMRITSKTRSGHVFIYEPDEHHVLLSLHQRDNDDNPEVWSAKSASEVCNRIRPWVFPSPRREPSPAGVWHEKRLNRLAAGLHGRTSTVTCRTVEPHPEVLATLTAPARDQLALDFKQLELERILQNFPPDSTGKLDLKTTVLLRPYATTTPPGPMRDLALAAIGPDKRSDPQTIQIKVIDLIIVNQTHRWDNAPWLWTRSSIPATEFIGTSAGGDNPENQRAIHSLSLLDAGLIEDALALYGVFLSSDLHKLLGGEHISPPACCAHPDDKWTELLVNTLQLSAPWRLPQALADESARLQQWAAQKRGRRAAVPNLKFLIFPGQFHSRKASLMLTLRDGSPQFVIEATASNARIHDTAWKLPLVADFIRHRMTPQFS